MGIYLSTVGVTLPAVSLCEDVQLYINPPTQRKDRKRIGTSLDERRQNISILHTYYERYIVSLLPSCTEYEAQIMVSGST